MFFIHAIIKESKLLGDIMMTEEYSTENEVISNSVSEKIDLSLHYLEQQTSFIEEVMTAIRHNELERVLYILDNHKNFVTGDFVHSFAGKAIADYLVEAASNHLMTTYPFLHQLDGDDNDKKRTFYIGNWYKANTRHILFLNINLQNNRYALDLFIAPEVLEEWNQMDDVKGTAHTALKEKEEALLDARAAYEEKRQQALAQHSKKLDELRKKYHALTSKVLKKQSEIQEVDQEIKKETEVLRNIEEQPEIFFNDEHQKIVSIQESIEALKARVDNMNLIEALVKREKNEIQASGTTVSNFIRDIDLLSERWKMN